MGQDASKDEIAQIIEEYNVGQLMDFRRLEGGTVQTNLWFQTTLGEYVLRFYGNRTMESVLFETDLLRHLKNHSVPGPGFPCPAPLANMYGEYVGTSNKRPYVVFEFVKGQHIERLDEKQRKQLIQKVAELHRITEDYLPIHKESRWNYDAEFCLTMAQRASERINTENARQKLSWLEQQLRALDLPGSLPKGICHCDLNSSNVLFDDGEFCALLDFDDANYTYFVLDLVGLIESAAWRHDHDEVLNFDAAKKVISEYSKWRPLSETEAMHLFDVYKLSVLIDCVWYFERGDAKDFYEKRKIDFLNSLGRAAFYRKLFSDG